jgi:hypothetical protein
MAEGSSSGSDWHARLAALRDEIDASSLVRLTRFQINDPVSSDAIERARKRWHGPLPDMMEEFYRANDGFVLEWEALDVTGLFPQGPHAGSINLLPLAEVFGEWKDVVWFDDWDGGDRFRGVLPLDRFAPEAAATLYQRGEEAGVDRVYSHYLGEDLDASTYSFAQYVELLLESRGYYYWVRALPEATHDGHSAQAFRHDMPQLFPDFRSDLFDFDV